MGNPGYNFRLTCWMSISMLFVLSVFTGCKKLDPERIIKIKTGPIIDVSYNTCSLEGTILDIDKNGISEHGFCWSPAVNPQVTDPNIKLGQKTLKGDFQGILTGLNSGTTYYVRAYATNSVNTTYGNQISFTTVRVPTLTTNAATSVTNSTAISGGNITSDGGDEVTARGICWSTNTNPTTDLQTKTYDGTGTGDFISNLTGLYGNTKYYVRAYATNSAGTEYGAQISFNTTSTGTVTDIEGNIYKTVTIDTQTWMAENLKTTKYKDGTSIPFVTDNNIWKALSTPAYCWYANDTNNNDIYGALYNWFTVTTDKLCPAGWHVPTIEEWNTLLAVAGGETLAGGRLKQKDSPFWDPPNTGATDDFGFKGLPGGVRNSDAGSFFWIRQSGMFWSATSNATDKSYAWAMNYNSTILNLNISYNKFGFSVRCVID